MLAGAMSPVVRTYQSSPQLLAACLKSFYQPLKIYCITRWSLSIGQRVRNQNLPNGYARKQVKTLRACVLKCNYRVQQWVKEDSIFLRLYFGQMVIPMQLRQLETSPWLQLQSVPGTNPNGLEFTEARKYYYQHLTWLMIFV